MANIFTQRNIMNRLLFSMTMVLLCFQVHAYQTTFWRYPHHNVTKNIACLEITDTIEDPSPYFATLHAIQHNADGLLLIIDSGGGNTGASETIFRELRTLSQYIPIVTVIKNICASGAYLLACGSSYIVSPQGAMVGSIGSLMAIEKNNVKSFQKKTSNKEGNQESVISGEVSYEIISDSNKKTITNPLSGELSDEDRESIQQQAREMSTLFADMVAQSRNLHHNRDAWATGEIFTGATALELGLIDEIGSYTDALVRLHTLMQTHEPKHIIQGLNITRWEVGDC